MRKVYAPYSQSGENVSQTPLEGYIEVQQKVIPTIETGFVNENGLWIGNVSSDNEFIIYSDEAIANNAHILTPSVNADGSWPLDMTGYTDIQIAIRPSNAGNYAILAVMGPDSISYANLNPVDAAADLFGALRQDAGDVTTLTKLFNDSAQALIADVWNIFTISTLRNQKLLQFKVTNNSGDISTIDTAFMRLV